MPRIPYSRDRMKGRAWYFLRVKGEERIKELEALLARFKGDYMMKRSGKWIRYKYAQGQHAPWPNHKCQPNQNRKVAVLLAEDEDFMLVKLSTNFDAFELGYEKKFTRDHQHEPMAFH